MKTALILLCAIVVAVQGQNSLATRFEAHNANLGENPWVVHLRVAVSTSGFLNSCAGVLIDSSWVLTSASCVDNARFIWLRYGAINVVNPDLVTETNAIRLHENWDRATGTDNIALVSINRVVETTENISPILLSTNIPESASFCGYGDKSDGSAGEILACSIHAVRFENNWILTNGASGTTRYDLGGPLVGNGRLIGILTYWADSSLSGIFLPAANYRGWIETTAGIRLD